MSTGTASRPRLQRDRVTWTLYAPFVMWGWFLYAFSPAVPLLAAEQGTSLGVAGLHGTAMAIGGIAAGFLTGRIAPRYGRRTQAVIGAGIVVVGVALLIAGGGTPFTLSGVLVAAVGGNLVLSSTQPALAVHHGPHGPAAVTEGNGLGAAVGLLAPLVLGATVAAGLGWRPSVAVVLVLATLTGLALLRLPRVGALAGGGPLPRLRRRKPRTPEQIVEDAVAAYGTNAPLTEPCPVPPVEEEVGTAEGEAIGGGSVGAGTVGAGAAGGGLVDTEGTTATARRPFGPAFRFFLAALLCGVAIEFATTFWASELLVQQTGASKSLASAAVSALLVGMSVSRFVVGPLSMRKAPEKLLLVAFVVAGVGWALFWLAGTPTVAIAGLVLAGLGYGAHYPLAVSLVLRSSDGRPDQAQARATIGTGAAVALAPWLLGVLADAFGAYRAFLLVPALIVVGGLAVALGLRAVHAALRPA